LLYYRGNIRNDNIGVAIVGARKCSEYGKMVTVEAAEFLAENNITVISGMAKGIDGYSHTACLKAGGYTIAILGCGLDISYLKEHDTLMQRIIDQGVVISEYPPGTKPNQSNFPKRNRLISAWCNKLLVVEASENSGALITAAFAMEQKREVLAVPHSIYHEGGKGTNRLIEKGSKIYLNPYQLIDNTGFQIMNSSLSKASFNKTLSFLEETILGKIKDKPMSLNELLIELIEDRQRVIETVSVMEVEGKLLSTGGVLKAAI
jgi:DNA processing protein